MKKTLVKKKYSEYRINFQKRKAWLEKNKASYSDWFLPRGMRSRNIAEQSSEDRPPLVEITDNILLKPNKIYFGALGKGTSPKINSNPNK